MESDESGNSSKCEPDVESTAAVVSLLPLASEIVERLLPNKAIDLNSTSDVSEASDDSTNELDCKPGPGADLRTVRRLVKQAFSESCSAHAEEIKAFKQKFAPRYEDVVAYGDTKRYCFSDDEEPELKLPEATFVSDKQAMKKPRGNKQPTFRTYISYLPRGNEDFSHPKHIVPVTAEPDPSFVKLRPLSTYFVALPRRNVFFGSAEHQRRKREQQKIVARARLDADPAAGFAVELALDGIPGSKCTVEAERFMNDRIFADLVRSAASRLGLDRLLDEKSMALADPSDLQGVGAERLFAALGTMFPFLANGDELFVRFIDICKHKHAPIVLPAPDAMAVKFCRICKRDGCEYHEALANEPYQQFERVKLKKVKRKLKGKAKKPKRPKEEENGTSSRNGDAVSRGSSAGDDESEDGKSTSNEHSSAVSTCSGQDSEIESDSGVSSSDRSKADGGHSRSESVVAAAIQVLQRAVSSATSSESLVVDGVADIPATDEQDGEQASLKVVSPPQKSSPAAGIPRELRFLQSSEGFVNLALIQCSPTDGIVTRRRVNASIVAVPQKPSPAGAVPRELRCLQSSEGFVSPAQIQGSLDQPVVTRHRVNASVVVPKKSSPVGIPRELRCLQSSEGFVSRARIQGSLDQPVVTRRRVNASIDAIAAMSSGRDSASGRCIQVKTKGQPVQYLAAEANLPANKTRMTVERMQLGGNKEQLKEKVKVKSGPGFYAEKNFYVPCEHKGPCNYDVAGCHCYERHTRCEVACSCYETCPSKYGGCKCTAGSCRTNKCECFMTNRECSPLVCGCYEKYVVTGKELCENCNIRKGKFKNCDIKPSPVAGLGLFAAEPIKSGELVGCYTGEVVTRAEGDRRALRDPLNNYCFASGIPGYSIDARYYGNQMRFANNSTTATNMQVLSVLVDGEHHLAAYATRDINEGEELFLNYGFKKFHNKYYLPNEPSLNNGSSKRRKNGELSGQQVLPADGEVDPETLEAIKKAMVEVSSESENEDE